MSIEDKQTQKDNIISDIVNNTQKAITGDQLQQRLVDLVDSNLNISGLQSGDVPTMDGSPSGMMMTGSGSLLAPTNFMVEQGSISFGEIARLYESGSFLSIENNTNDARFQIVDYFAPPTIKSPPPSYFPYVPREDDFIDVNTAGTADLDITGPNGQSWDWQPDYNGQLAEIQLFFASAATNVRMRIEDVQSGRALGVTPDMASWERDIGDDFDTGWQTISLLSSPVFAGDRQQRFIIRGDTGELRGTAGAPLFRVKRQPSIGRVTLQERSTAIENRLPIMASGSRLISGPIEQDGNDLFKRTTNETVIVNADADDEAHNLSSSTVSYDWTPTQDVTAEAIGFLAEAQPDRTLFAGLTVKILQGTNEVFENTGGVNFYLTQQEQVFIEFGEDLTFSNGTTYTIEVGWYDGVLRRNASGSVNLHTILVELTEREALATVSDAGSGLTLQQVTDEHYNRYLGSIANSGADFDTFPSAVRNDIVQAIDNSTVNGLVLVKDAMYRCIVDTTAGGNSAHWEEIPTPAQSVAIQDSGWINLPLSSGWTNNTNSTWGTSRYRKIGNEVNVNVSAFYAANLTNAIHTVGILPAGYRPPFNVPIVWMSGGQYRQGLILPGGAVQGVNMRGGNQFARVNTTFFVD